MSGVFSSTPYESFASALEKAITWIETLGIHYEKTRVGEYKRAIDTLLEVYKTKDLERTRAEFVRIATAVFEANDLIAIHKGLASKYDQEIREHIGKCFIKGPADYRKENVSASSNLPRNTAFELLLASKIVSADIDLDFSIKTDIACHFDGRSILLECKRPQSNRGIENNVKKAFKQLEKKYQNPSRSRHRGIIAIDITKLLNPEFMLYVQPNAAALHQGLSNLVDNFIIANEKYWQLRRNSKTIAVIIRVGTMGINQEKSDMLTHCWQYVVTPINNSGDRNIKTARRLTDAIGGTT